MKESVIKVLKVKPHEHPEVYMLKNTLEAMQEAVGGYIETVTLAADCCIICNEEGRLEGLPYNLTFCGVSFVGTILVVGVAGDAFTGLDDRQIDFLIGNLKGRSSRRNAAR